jgi:hypothetical protein
MIEIKVDLDTVEVEMKKYYFDFHKPESRQAEMLLLLQDVIDKAKFSGESISLWRVDDETKRIIKDW